MKRKKPEPTASELVSDRGDAERFTAAARQAFWEAPPPSRVDAIMAEGFRIAERGGAEERTAC